MPPRATCGATEPQNTLLGKGAPKINSDVACLGFPGLKVKCTQASQWAQGCRGMPLPPGSARTTPALLQEPPPPTPWGLSAP